MSTFAFKASLIREIEQAMQRIQRYPLGFMDGEVDFQDGQLDAYAHILMLLKDEDL